MWHQGTGYLAEHSCILFGINCIAGRVPVTRCPQQVVEEEEIKKQVLAKYRPLTSPDGKTGWKALSPYSVLFPPAVFGHREVWVETALNHFCTVTNAVKVNIPGYEHNASDEAPYYKADFPGFRDRAKDHFKGKGKGGSTKPKPSSKPMVRFGNATKARVNPTPVVG